MTRRKNRKNRNNMTAREYFVILSVFLLIGVLGGCSMRKADENPGKPLAFFVLSKELLPKEVRTEIEKRNAKAFDFTYVQGENLYICVGYGPQKGQDYSISVDSCVVKEDGIYVNTTLLGPKESEKDAKGISYPYIVLRTEYLDLPVIVE